MGSAVSGRTVNPFGHTRRLLRSESSRRSTCAPAIPSPLLSPVKVAPLNQAARWKVAPLNLAESWKVAPWNQAARWKVALLNPARWKVALLNQALPWNVAPLNQALPWSRLSHYAAAEAQALCTAVICSRVG